MDLLVKFRWILASSIVAVAIAGMPFLDNALTPNNELSIWFVRNDPALKAYEEFNLTYGNDRLVILMIYDSTGIWQPHRLQQIQALTRDMQNIAGVRRISSVTGAKDLFRTRQNDTIRIRYASYFEGVNIHDAKALKRVRQQLQASPSFTHRFINSQWTSAMLFIQLKAFDEVDEIRDRIIDEIEALAAGSLELGVYYLGGLDFVTYGLNKLSAHDFRLFMSITYVVMFLFVYLFFRRWEYVALCIVAMTASVLITLSIYGFLGYQMNLFSLVIPTLVVILGLINILHIINEFEFYYRRHGRVKSQRAIVTGALRHVFRPCLFATLTTIIGFMSLLSSSTAVLKEFGVFAAIGILIAFVCSFVFSAVFFQCIRIDSTHQVMPHWIADKLVLLSEDIRLNRNKYWIAMSSICLLAIFGIYRMRTDMFVMGYFPSSSEIVRNHNFITRHWGNYIPIDFLVTTTGESSFKSAAMLNMLDGFQAAVNEMPEISSSLSILDMLHRASVVVLKKDVEELLTSSTQTHRLIQSLLRQTDFDLSGLVSEDFHTVRVTLTGPFVSVSELEEKINEILHIGEKHFGDKAMVHVASYPALFLNIMNYAIDSMVKCLCLAILLIMVTLTILLKSLRMALVAMIPNLFPIFMMFSFMGITGINLDLATATVAAIAIGVAVDDTIHLLSYYQKIRKESGYSISEALNMTHFHIGRIVVISSIVLCFGYSTLLLASIKTAVYFGLLTIVAIIGALIGDLILLPLLLGALKRKEF